MNTKNYTDIKRLVWIEKFLPTPCKPYAYLMRLDRPIGVWLLLLPCLWGIVLGTQNIKHLNSEFALTIILFSIGSIIMRGAGCVINDIWDRDLDTLVERTKSRPIANGDISRPQALLFLASLLLIGFWVLIQFNTTTVTLGFLTLPFIGLYPLMKRITWWPQVFLGLTFNFGALMGWTAITGEITAATLMLYMGAIFWTIGYDTIYAHQDKEDDAMAGIKSTALKFGAHSKKWVSSFYALSFTCFVYAYTMAHTYYASPYILSFIAVALHFIWQIRTWDIHDKESALKIFKSNKALGLLILLCFSTIWIYP